MLRAKLPGPSKVVTLYLLGVLYFLCIPKFRYYFHLIPSFFFPPVFFLTLVGGYGVQVSVQLEAFPDNSADLVRKNEANHCVCGSRQKTVSWTVTPKSLGE